MESNQLSAFGYLFWPMAGCSGLAACPRLIVTLRTACKADTYAPSSDEFFAFLERKENTSRARLTAIHHLARREQFRVPLPERKTDNPPG